MSSEVKARKPWRLALLLLVGAYVGIVAFLVLHNESSDETPSAKLRVTRAPSPSPETEAPARINVGAAAPIFTINAAVQKAGPPDPAAEKSSANSAAKAADAAAALAKSAPGVTD